MQFTPLEIPDVILITPKVFKDPRGFFMETYKASVFKANGIPEEFVQDNYSYSIKDTLRGLHYQLNPDSQGKLVRCPVGKIFDVAVDIRQGSKTFGKWVSAILDEEAGQMLYIPPGFAHGFLVLSDFAHVHYKTTSEYAPMADRGIRWNDPEIGINWPVKSTLLSEKDSKLPSLSEADNNFFFQACVPDLISA